jgi:membrane-bound lytic murein transglycosylase D
VTHRAGKSETVATVAKRYRVSAAQVAQWNKVATGASFAPGQSVIVFVAQKQPSLRPSKAKKPTKRKAVPRKR